MTIYDITIPLRATMAVWPGDTPYSFMWNMRIRDGASVNLGSICMSAHAGTHADAPYHFLNSGATIDECDLSIYCGPAIVIDVQDRPIIECEQIAGIDLARTPRVLFKTGAWTDYSYFPDSIPVIAANVPAYLHRHGVRLVGVDVPSVDPLESKDLPIHHALAAHGIYILESLDLQNVPAGEYELLALPLNLVGADGAPVRAVLRK